MLARSAFDIFYDLFAEALHCLSHRRLLNGNDEPQTPVFQITLSGPIIANVREMQGHMTLSKNDSCKLQDLRLGQQVTIRPWLGCSAKLRFSVIANLTGRDKEVDRGPLLSVTTYNLVFMALFVCPIRSPPFQPQT